MSSPFVRPRVNYNLAITTSRGAIEADQQRLWSKALSDRNVLHSWTLPLDNQLYGNTFSRHFADGESISRRHLDPERPFVQFAEQRTRALRAANALLVINFGDANIYAKDNEGVSPVSNYITGETERAMHIALGMEKPVFLSEGYPENHPGVTMQPDALESLGVIAMDPILSIEERVDLMLTALEHQPMLGELEGGI